MHVCRGGEMSAARAWWVNDYQGIPLCKVCDDCEGEKLSKYNPWVLSGYNEGGIDEPLNEA